MSKGAPVAQIRTARPRRGLAELAEDGALGAGQGLGEEPHAGLAVGERAVAVRRECPVRAQEAREGPRGERDRVPGHLVPGARPGDLSGRGDDGLDERPVEARVVRDDEVRAREELGRGRGVDCLAGEVLVGEAGEARDLGRHGPARVLAPGAGGVPVDVRDVAVERVVEGQHRELDEGIVLGAEAGRLAVDEKSTAERARAGWVGMVLEDEGVESAGLRRVDASARGGGAGHDGVPLPALGAGYRDGGSQRELPRPGCAWSVRRFRVVAAAVVD